MHHNEHVLEVLIFLRNLTVNKLQSQVAINQALKKGA